jgi:hypothetical protein
MQTTTREWIHKTVDELPDRETEQLKDYLEFLTWKSKQQESEPKQTGKNPIVQRIVKAMEKPPHLTHEDLEALRQSIKEGKMPLRFDSPFEPGERQKQGRRF